MVILIACVGQAPPVSILDLAAGAPDWAVLAARRLPLMEVFELPNSPEKVLSGDAAREECAAIAPRLDAMLAEVLFRIEEDEEGRVGKITEEDARGTVKVEVTLMDYRMVSGHEFPHRIFFAGYHANAVRGNLAHYEVTQSEFDMPLPEDSFRVASSDEQLLWDEDAGAAVGRLPN